MTFALILVTTEGIREDTEFLQSCVEIFMTSTITVDEVCHLLAMTFPVYSDTFF